MSSKPSDYDMCVLIALLNSERLGEHDPWYDYHFLKENISERKNNISAFLGQRTPSL